MFAVHCCGDPEVLGLALRLLFIAGVFVVHCWGDPEGSCLPYLLFTAGVILRGLASRVCCSLLG